MDYQVPPGRRANLQELFGFDLQKVLNNRECIPEPIGCGKKVEEFRDDVSEKEYGISGLCQSCQDKIFNPTSK